jgi:hypothetical protein
MTNAGKDGDEAPEVTSEQRAEDAGVAPPDAPAVAQTPAHEADEPAHAPALEEHETATADDAHEPAHAPALEEHEPAHATATATADDTHEPAHAPALEEHEPAHAPALEEHEPAHATATADDAHEPAHAPALEEHEPAHTPVVLLGEPELPPADLVPVPMAGPAPRVLPEPYVLELSPNVGPVFTETRVALRGAHLHRESIVRIDGLIAMTVGAIEPRELSVRTPPRATPGAVDVTVQNPGAPTLVLAGAFHYEPLPPPRITGVAPRRGGVKGGTEISVNGQGFVAGSVVLVDGLRTKTVFVDAHTLEARTPPGKPGAMVDVAVENPDAKRAVEPRAFAYDERYR